MKLALLTLIWLVSIGAAAATNRIVSCEDEQGIVWFTDLPCPDAREVKVSRITVVETPELTDAERRRLAEIGRSPARVRAAGAQTLVDEQRLCADAQRGLDELRDTRRRGYKVSQSAALDSRERALRTTVDKSCR